MEKFFINKRIWKVLVIVFLIIMTFQIIVPVTCVFAAEPDKERTEDSVQPSGGTLATPIASLISGIGDGFLYLLHRFIMGQDIYPIITITDEENDEWWQKLGNVIRTAGAAITGTVGGAVGFVTGNNDNKVTATLEWITDKLMPNQISIPVFSYSPEEIFKGKILLFNVNFFDDTKKDIKAQEENGKLQYYYYEDPNGETLSNGVKGFKTSQTDSVIALKGVISKWYVIIRNICIVAMLSILLYIGIKIILSTVASDKAKHIEMLKDWAVGLCLIFVIHYVMAFSNVLVDKISNIIATTSNDIVSVPLRDDYNGNLKRLTDDLGLGDEYWDGDILYYPTNIMGRIRLEMQLQGNDGGQSLGLAFCYFALVVETIIFTYKYITRVLYMAFLTLIAPFVGLTYCIDKTNDGQAQGFNKWLKEYLFNLLIQPLHLLLYFVLVGSVTDLKQNILYSIVALVFMIPAEKLLRSLFGFENAKTPPSLLGTGAALSMASGALNRIRGGGKSGGGRSHGNESEGGNRQIRSANNNQESDDSEIFGAGVDETSAIAGSVGENYSNGSASEEGETLPSGAEGETLPGGAEGGTLPGGAEGETLPSGAEGETLPGGVEGGTLPGGAEENSSQATERQSAQNTSSQSTTRPSQPQTYTAKKKNKFRDGARRAGRKAFGDLRNTTIRGVKGLPRATRRVVGSGMRTAIRGTAAVGGAIMAGAATAASTGDMSKTMQAMTAGATTGSTIGDRAAREIGGGVDTLNEGLMGTVSYINDLRKEAFPADKEKQASKRIKEMMGDTSLQNKLSEEFGEDGLKDMKESGELETYFRNGAKDAKDIIALRHLRKHIEDQGSGKQAAINAAAGVYKINRDMAGGKDTNNMGADRDKFSKALNDKFEREVGEKKEAGKLGEKTLGWLDYYNKKRFH